MKSLILLLMGLMSVNSYADATCKVLNDDANAAVSWSGVCENGIADGVGELIYRPDKPIKTFGMVKKGNLTGLHLSTQGGVDYHVIYFSSGGENVQFLGPYYSSKSDLNLIPQHQKWIDFNGIKDAQNNKPSMTYEDVLNRVKTYVAQKHESSVDFEVFKAYLEGRVRVTGEDDAPVLGAALKPNGGKAKKKK